MEMIRTEGFGFQGVLEEEGVFGGLKSPPQNNTQPNTDKARGLTPAELIFPPLSLHLPQTW